MLPTSNIEEKDAETESYKAFYIDFENGTIGGLIDGKEALIQAVRITLMTERYKYPIFSHSYGTDYRGVLESEYCKAMGKLKKAIYDSLIYDERINEIGSFEFERQGTKMIVSFRISSIYGPIDYKTEVEE